ncbi:unnamed protein product [Porites evermanni]|uniref:Uncharacterized protein n=1 Tax=Porites evermanni TaxID=104178 RepID=A0ABN8QCH8_9CNID|nr:unnamed protein product [Porites evermanni]
MATPGQKEREAELHSVLKAANLLDYYQSFLEQGGDDVQQFCDASEDEFKEIIALVGMSTKPLHTKRLQKALVEWKSKRGHSPSGRVSAGSWMDKWSPSPQAKQPVSTPSPAGTKGRKRLSSSGTQGGPEKRVVELKLPPMEVIIDWEKLDPERQQLIRDHSRIYGRDLKKRKTDSLNSHEQMINEAAAQLCLRDPTLLVRRDELFTMARRVVRDSGFTFVHGHSRSKFSSTSSEEMEGELNDFRGRGEKETLARRPNDFEKLRSPKKAASDYCGADSVDQIMINISNQVSTFKENRRKIEPKEIPSCLIPHLLVIFTEQHEMFVTTLYTSSNISLDEVATKDITMALLLIQKFLMKQIGLGEDNDEDVQETNGDQSRTISVPEAVVTQILPPATGIPTTSSNTVNLPQRQEPLNSEEDSSVRALYTAFMPQHLQTEVVQQVQQQPEGGHSHVMQTGYSPALVNAAVSSDPTINALLSLGAKDKVLLPGMLPPGVSVAAVPVTSGVAVTTQGITVVMPGQSLQGNVNVPWQ